MLNAQQSRPRSSGTAAKKMRATFDLNNRDYAVVLRRDMGLELQLVVARNPLRCTAEADVESEREIKDLAMCTREASGEYSVVCTRKTAGYLVSTARCSRAPRTAYRLRITLIDHTTQINPLLHVPDAVLTRFSPSDRYQVWLRSHQSHSVIRSRTNHCSSRSY